MTNLWLNAALRPLRGRFWALRSALRTDWRDIMIVRMTYMNSSKKKAPVEPLKCDLAHLNKSKVLENSLALYSFVLFYFLDLVFFLFNCTQSAFTSFSDCLHFLECIWITRLENRHDPVAITCNWCDLFGCDRCNTNSLVWSISVCLYFIFSFFFFYSIMNAYFLCINYRK